MENSQPNKNTVTHIQGSSQEKLHSRSLATQKDKKSSLKTAKQHCLCSDIFKYFGTPIQQEGKRACTGCSNVPKLNKPT